MNKLISLSLVVLGSAQLICAATPAIDTFTGANGTALTSYSANWTNADTGSFEIYSNSVRAAGGAAAAYWNADRFNETQYSQITLNDVSGGGNLGAAVRMRYRNYYLATYQNSEILLGKVIAGAWNSRATHSAALAVGDVLKITVSGTTLNVYVNGALVIGPVTDSSLSSGLAGISGYASESVSATSWEGGSGDGITPWVEPPLAANTIVRIPGDYAATPTGFQAALDAAAQEQRWNCSPYIIEIAAGTTIEFTTNPGASLPTKSCKQYVTVRSSGAFVDGQRLDPTTESASLATLKAPGYVGALLTGTADHTLTSYWRFEGLDFWIDGGAYNNPNYYALILGGGADSIEPSTRPHHFEVKHCWFRGKPGARNLVTGIGVGANNVRILDSYFEAIASVTQDAKAIGIGENDGPVEVRNNRISGAAQGVLIGGMSYAKGQLPSFLTFIGNHFARDGYMRYIEGYGAPTRECRVGNVYRDATANHDWVCSALGVWVDQGTTDLTARGSNLVKTLFESKASRGTYLFGNLFENAFYPLTWGGSNAITVNQTSQYDIDPWVTVSDLRVTGNKYTKGNSFMGVGYANGMACTSENPPPCYYSGPNNIRVHDNLGYDLADVYDLWGSTVGNAGFVSFPLGSFDNEVRNNTLLNATTAGSGATTQIGYIWRNEYVGDTFGLQKVYGQNILRDNIAPAGGGLKGVLSTGLAFSGECTARLMLRSDGGADVRNNIWTHNSEWITGGNSGIKSPLTCNFVGGDYLFYWTSGVIKSGGWADVVDAGTYKVKPAYRNTGSDGRDPGANIDFVNRATAGAERGDVNSFLDMKIRSMRATSNTATLYLTAPSMQACTLESSLSNTFDTVVGFSTYVQNGRDVRADVSGLVPGTYYFVRARCDSHELEGTLRTAP